MTRSVAIIVRLVFTYVLVTVDATALRNERKRQRNVELGPIVAPLYITQYDRSDGASTSVADFYYQLPLSVGTPARNFNLTLDLYGGANLLFAHNYTGTTNCAQKQPARNLYSFSGTAVDINADVNVASDFFNQPYINVGVPSVLCRQENLVMDGDDLHDDLKISNTAVGQVEFNLVQTINSLNPGWKADGIFAYYMDDLDEDDTRFMYNFRNLSTVLHLLSGAQPAGSPTLGGHLIFGTDSENSMCFGDWTAVDTTLPEFTGQFYGVNLVAVEIGNRTIVQTGTIKVGALQLISSYIKMKKSTLDHMAKALGGDYNFRTGTFTVDCGAISTLPDIVFRIKTHKSSKASASGSMEYRVSASVYAKKLNPADKQCTLMLSECDSDDYD